MARRRHHREHAVNSEKFRQLEDLFHEAVSLTPPQRDDFITRGCGDDADLRDALKRMLAADGAGSPVARVQEEIERVVQATLAGAGESPGDRIDRYLLKDRIGEGGFGVVYLAEQISPVRRDVALKIIKLGMDTRQVIARFEAERQALAIMNHPGIATVLDAGATPTGRPYFVMELVRGRPITDHADTARLSVRERLALFIQVCDAVQHAHQKGVIHRDLKPSNVLVTSAANSAAPIPKIIDFGIAKATTGTRLSDATIHTEARQFVGTPEYMSPEQTGGRGGLGMGDVDIDTRSDVYSLGVLLYELLTGAMPFETSLLRSASYPEMLKIIREAPPARPSSRVGVQDEVASARATTPPALRRQMQGDLDWIILKCLEKERDRRYHTAHDLSLDIQRFLANQPVIAGPPSVRYRLRKFVRRHRAPLAAAALAVAALLAGLGFATYGLLRAKQQRNMALTALEFVEDVLAAPDPNRGNVAGITVAETLDLAAARLDDGDLQDSLEVQARLRRMLGSTYMAMGLHDKAAPQLEHALTLAQQTYGDSSAEAGMAWNDIGELNRFRGNFAQAEAAYNQALRIQSRLPRSMASAQTFNNYGLLRQSRGEFEEALHLQRQALDMRLALFGDNHPEVATSYNNLGALCMAAGNLPAAEDYYRHALEMRQRLLEPGHWRLANTQVNLARVLAERRQLDEADSLASAALVSSRETFGDVHSQVGRALFCLGIIREAQGRPAEAEELLRSSVTTQRAAHPAGHPEIAHVLSGLGELLIDLHRGAEAEPLLREALHIRRAKFDPDHPLVGIAASLLGEALLQQGRTPDAAALLEEGHRVIAANKYVAPAQRRRDAMRLAALAHARGDSAEEQRWTAEAEKLATSSP
jgi:eukaryotic-like serine/threonine-protein kinase